MDERSLSLLELPAIRDALAGETASALGRELAESLIPAAAEDDVRALAIETDEAALLRAEGVRGPAGAVGLADMAAAGARGASLEPADLLAAWQSVTALLALREAVTAAEDLAPALAGRMAGVDHGALTRLEGLLEAALEPSGAIRDSASPELASARRRLRAAREEAAELLRSLAARHRDALQEQFTTRRGGRPVLAVKAGSRREVPGLVHDRSASGETLFIEPLEVVEAHNAIAEIEAEERAEEREVLARLSRAVGESADALAHASAEAAATDLALARAALSLGWDGCRVEIGERIEVAAARHPLLPRDEVVPVDLPLGDVRALVVSGPNTGGKTVALKTLGLMVVLHQCGLRPPAARAVLPVVRSVLADIGDEQSISRSLSTFSAHVRVLRQIIADAGPSTLVLLDELASGTDPSEGAALAAAVMERLMDQGARVAVTTHNSDIKSWAADTDGAANAAVGIDPDELVPDYTLRIGEPGASHALGIAEHLGLDAAVLKRARELLDPARVRAEGLLADADAARAAARAEAEAAAAARAAAERERREAEARGADLEARIAKTRAGAAAEKAAARAQVEAELASAREALAALRAEIAAARKQERGRRAAGDQRGEGERDRRLSAADRAAARADSALRETAAAPEAPARAPTVGDLVRDTLMGFRGELVEIDGGTGVVRGERGRMRIPLERLSGEGRPAPPEQAAPAPARLPDPVAAELDLRGMRAEEARAAARSHIDVAGAAGQPRIRIIHGMGTGTLRAAVREELDGHPLVLRLEGASPGEGGDGATLVHLQDEGAGDGA